MDLGDFLASRTCRHVRDITRGTFRGELFQRSQQNPNSFPAWNGYSYSFFDHEDHIEIDLTNESEKGTNWQNVYDSLKLLKIGKDYKTVFEKIEVDRGNQGLANETISMRVYFRNQPTRGGRTTNEDKIFYAIYNSVLKPSFLAIYPLQKST